MHTTMFFRQQEEGLQIFIKGWELYQEIIAQNYMHHQEVIEVVKEATNGLENPRLLEVGCGDAYVVSQAFADRERISYTGVDMSGHALEYARRNLEREAWKLDLREGNMFDIVPQLGTQFDIVLAGYSLHHFGADRKAILLKRIRPLLNENGVLIVYDIFRREAESREDFLERILAYFREHWTRMNDGQMAEIHEHVRNNDYPETLDSMKSIGEGAGFKSFAVPYREENDFYGVSELR